MSNFHLGQQEQTLILEAFSTVQYNLVNYLLDARAFGMPELNISSYLDDALWIGKPQIIYNRKGEKHVYES